MDRIILRVYFMKQNLKYTRVQTPKKSQNLILVGDLEASLALSQGEGVRVSGSARTFANSGDDLVATSNEGLILRGFSLDLELVSVETRSQVKNQTAITYNRSISV